MTKAQLLRFIKMRNKCGFNSNLQFSFDAQECGFDVEDLGGVQKFTIDGFKGYRWNVKTTSGYFQVVEFGRTLYLNDHDSDTRSMFELMKRAKFEESLELGALDPVL